MKNTPGTIQQSTTQPSTAQQPQQARKLSFDELHKAAGNIQMAYYLDAAQRLGIYFKIVIPGLFVEFSDGSKRWRVHKSLTPINNSVAMSLAAYKNTCNTFLQQEGFPVPQQAKVDTVEDIFKFIRETGIKDVVIKPTRGFGGGGVTILPENEEAIRQAFDFAYKKCLSSQKPKVLVEEFIGGKHYRMVILDDKVIAATERIAAFVVGDGAKSIQQLIDSKNQELEAVKRSPIKIDSELHKAVAVQGLSLESVPQKDQTITVRFNANMTTGGSTRECLAEVHTKYHETAISAVQAIGLKLGGIDIISPDISNPDVRFAINEVNHNPGFRIHYMPDEGEAIDVALTVQKYILDNFNP